MSAREWLSAPARRQIAELVQDLERRTAAEIVVVVRARSGAYRHVDLAVASLLGFAALLVYVFHPAPFHDDVAPIAIAACWGAGALITAGVEAVKRPLVTRRARREAVRTAARAAFVDGGVGSTTSRGGLLIYISLFERHAEVVPDIGVGVGAMGPDWTEAVARLEAAVRRPSTVAAVSTALVAMGEVLARGMPIRVDDVDELPEEVPE